MKTNEIQKQNKIDLDPFYQALEDDRILLEEAFEILLEMINNEPETVRNLAILIKSDYRTLFNKIVVLSKTDQEKGSMPSCCG